MDLVRVRSTAFEHVVLRTTSGTGLGSTPAGRAPRQGSENGSKLR